jgi:hypothetical protein
MKRLIHGAGDSRFAALRQTERAPAPEGPASRALRRARPAIPAAFTALLHGEHRRFPVNNKKKTGRRMCSLYLMHFQGVCVAGWTMWRKNLSHAVLVPSHLPPIRHRQSLVDDPESDIILSKEDCQRFVAA